MNLSYLRFQNQPAKNMFSFNLGKKFLFYDKKCRFIVYNALVFIVIEWLQSGRWYKNVVNTKV
jgi:hypothetical protein